MLAELQEKISTEFPANLKLLPKALRLKNYDYKKDITYGFDTENFEEEILKNKEEVDAFILSQSKKYNISKHDFSFILNELSKDLRLHSYQKRWLYILNHAIDDMVNAIYGPTCSGKSYTQFMTMVEGIRIYAGNPFFICHIAPTTIPDVLQANISDAFEIIKKNKVIKNNTFENSDYTLVFPTVLYDVLTPEEKAVVNYYATGEFKSVYVFNHKDKDAKEKLKAHLRTKKYVVIASTSYYYVNYLVDVMEDLNSEGYFKKFPVKFSCFDEGHRQAHSSCMETLAINTSMNGNGYSKKSMQSCIFDRLTSFGFVNNVMSGTLSKEHRNGPLHESDFRFTLNPKTNKDVYDIIDTMGYYQKFNFHNLTPIEKFMVSLKNSPLENIMSLAENFRHNYGDLPLSYEIKEFKSVLKSVLNKVCFGKKGISLVKVTPHNRQRGISSQNFMNFVDAEFKAKKNKILYYMTDNHRLASSNDTKQFEGMKIGTILKEQPQIKMIVVIEKLTTGTSINNINSVIILQEELSENGEYLRVEQIIGRGVRPSDEDLTLVFLNILEKEREIINRILVERQTILPRKEYDSLQGILNPLLVESEWLVTDAMAEEFKESFRNFIDDEFIFNIQDQIMMKKNQFLREQNNDGLKRGITEGFEWDIDKKFEKISRWKQNISTNLSTNLEMRVHDWCPNAIERGGSGNREDMDIKLGDTWLAFDFKCSTRVKLSTSKKYYLESMALKDGLKQTNNGKVSNAMIYLATRLFIDEQLDKFDIVVDLVEFNGWESRSILDSQLLQSSDKHRVRNLFTISETV